MGFSLSNLIDIPANIVTLGGYGASKAADAQKDAAAQNAALQRENMALQKQQYEEGIKRFYPFLQAGYQGLGQLTGQDMTYTDPNTGKEVVVKGSGQGFDLMKGVGNAPSYDTEYTARLKDYAQSPAYQAQNTLGQQALQRQLNARGLNYGATGASAGAQLSQQLTAADYDKYRGDLAQRYKALQGEYSQKRDINQSEYNRLMDLVKIGQGGATGTTGAATTYGQQASEAFKNIGAANTAAGQAEAGYQSGMAAMPWKLASLATSAFGGGGGGGGWFGGGGSPLTAANDTSNPNYNWFPK